MRVFEEIIKDISMLIDIKIKNINRDITFKATVIEKVSDTKYKILYKKQYHTAWCLAKLVIGSTVHVCAPGNDWSELFINQSCTRKEFEELNNKIGINTSAITQLNSDLTGHKTVFTQDPAEFLPSAGNGFSHCSVLISGTGGNFTNAPPTRTSSVGSAWWNVLTFGSTTRCTQVAFYAFTVYAGGGLIYFRRQHDGTVSNWIQVG